MTRIDVKLLAALALLAAAPAARAQALNYQPIRVDVTVFGAYASADATSWGGGAAIEPKYNITDRIAAGLRFEGAAFVTQKVSVRQGSSETSVEQGARAVSVYALKGDYYLTASPVRPFVGLGLGYYRIGAGSQSVATGAAGATVVQTAAAFRGFGFAPQVGVNFGGFRLAATYNYITGGDMVMVSQSVGATSPVRTTLAKNYLAFELGGTFGGNRR